jgi:HK97 family phage major capsid protein
MNEEAKKAMEEIKTSVITSVTASVTEEVMKKVEEMKINRDGLNADDGEKVEQKEIAAKQLKKLANHEVKALVSGTATDGAELVPTYVASEIVRVAAANGLARRYGRIWPMQGSNVNIPTADSVSAYRIAEGAKVTSSQPTTGSISLNSKTVGVIIPVSRKLLQNATVSVVDMLNMLAGEALAKLEDQWAFLGLTSGEGIFQTSGVPGVIMHSGLTDYSDIEPEDLLDAIDKIDDNIGSDKLRWILSRSVLNALRKKRAVVGTDNQGFLFSGFGQSMPATMWDVPYSLSPVMPKTSDANQAGKKFMALADFSKLLIGDDQNYTMELSDQATITDLDGTTLINLFEQNMVALKVTGEIDMKLADHAKAFSYIATAAS